MEFLRFRAAVPASRILLQYVARMAPYLYGGRNGQVVENSDTQLLCAFATERRAEKDGVGFLTFVGLWIFDKHFFFNFFEVD